MLNISLRTRLTLLVLIALLPVFGLVTYISIRDQQQTLIRASENLLVVTKLAALSEERMTEGARQLLEAIASAPSVRGQNLSLCIEFFRNLRGKQPAYTNLAVIDLDGNLACTAVDVVGSRHFGDRQYFKDVLATKTFVIGEYLMGRATGRAVITFATPLYDNENTLKGVAFAAMDLEKRALAGEIAVPPHVSLMITDRHGTVIGADRSQRGPIGKPYPDPALYKAMKSRPTEVFEALDADGHERLYALATINSGTIPGLYAIASIARDDVLAPVKLELMLELAILVLVAALGVWMARRMGNKTIVTPTLQLLQQVNDLAGADTIGPSQKAVPRDEMLGLFLAFKKMAKILKLREAERDSNERALRATQDRLLAAQRIGRIGNWEFNIVTNEVWWSNEIYNIFGVSPDTFAATYESFLARILPDDREHFESMISRVLAGDELLNVEHRVVTDAGEIRWIHGLGERHVGADGNPIKLSGTVQDITDRKRAEEILRASEERYRLLFERNPHPMWVFSRQSMRFLAVNDAAVQRYGYSVAEFLSMTIADLRRHEQHNALRELVRAESGPARHSGIWQHKKKDGSYIDVDITAHDLEFAGQQARLVLANDVTERVRQDRMASCEAEALGGILSGLPLKTVLEKIALGVEAIIPGAMASVLLMDSDGVHLRHGTGPSLPAAYNQAIDGVAIGPNVGSCGTAAYRREAVIADDIAIDPLWNDYRELAREHSLSACWSIPVLDALGTVLATFAIYYREPRSPKIEDLIVANRMAQIVGIAVERDQKDVALRSSETRFRSVFLDAATGIAVSTVDGQLLETNAAYCQMLGYTVDEIKGMNFLLLTYEDDRPRNLELIQELLSGKRENYVVEKRYLAKDGRIVWGRVSVSPQRNATGQIITIVAVTEDITKQKAVEEQLQRSQAFLSMASRIGQMGAWQIELPNLVMTWSDEVFAIHELSPRPWVDLDEGLNFYSTEARATLNKLFRDCVVNGVPYDVELPMVTAKGREIWVRVMGQAVRNAAGRTLRVQGALQDISAQKEADAREQALAGRLVSTLESISDGFVTIDRDWRYTFVNSQAERLMGLSRLDLLGKKIADVFPNQVNSVFRQQYQKAFDENLPVRFEEFYQPTGLWFAVNVYPSANGLAVYFRDITESREAQAQLRLLETAVSRLNDIVVITDAEPLDEPGPRIVYVNDAFICRTGYSREEVIGRSPRFLNGPKSQIDVLNNIRATMEKWQPVRAELINYTKAGEPFWMEMDMVPIANDTGSFTHWVSVERDITERKLAEEKIARTNRALQTLSQCNEALIRAATEHELLTQICEIAVQTGGYKMAWVGYAMNDEGKRIIPQAHAGYEAGYLNKMPFTWSEDDKFGRGPAGVTVRTGQAVVAPDFTTTANFSPWKEEALSRGYAGVITLPLKDKERFFGLFVLYTPEVREITADELHLMQELANDLAFGIIALQTRAERIRAQQEIESLNAELEERVRERTEQLEVANKELESFSYSISHDLRAPLRTIEGFSSAVMADFAPLLPPDGKRFLERIQSGALRMGLLIDDLLAFSQMSRQELRRQTCDTGNLVHEVLESLAQDYPAASSQVEIGDLPASYSDISLLRQVWVNLISNALKYSAKKEAPRVQIGCQLGAGAGDEGEQVFFVRDNGAGFDIAYIDKLFGVFQRLHTEKEFKGTGVGLAIVKRIVERHGGRVWAEGVEHEGATFYFTLPKERKVELKT